MQETRRRSGHGLATTAMVAFLLGATGGAWAGQQTASASGGGSPLTLAAGTTIELVAVRPVAMRTAKAGDPLYAEVSYPVTVGESLAIPAGTFVQGRMVAVTPPTRKNQQATLDVVFTQIIFANGFVVPLPDAPPGAPLPAEATEMRVTVQVSTANDLLLDNGAPLEMVLAAPLTVDANQVAAAMPLTRAPQPGSLRSATACRPTPGSPGIPGTPGTPDTVIPGNPGTPDTVIPGAPGMPDTVIPGTPATPDTIIPGTPGDPGTPGTPATVCPPAPLVLSCSPVVRVPGTPAGTKAAH